MLVFQPFIPTRLDQIMYITQILEKKRRGIAFFILLVPYEQLKLIFFLLKGDWNRGSHERKVVMATTIPGCPPPPTATAYC